MHIVHIGLNKFTNDRSNLWSVLFVSSILTMHETEAEFGTREEENVVGIWGFGLIIIIFGVITFLYYLRYVDITRSFYCLHWMS